jgi:hypothetical protein
MLPVRGCHADIEDRGGWLSDPLSEHAYGRRGALFIAGLFSLASCIGSGYIKSWYVSSASSESLEV